MKDPKLEEILEHIRELRQLAPLTGSLNNQSIFFALEELEESSLELFSHDNSSIVSRAKAIERFVPALRAVVELTHKGGGYAERNAAYLYDELYWRRLRVLLNAYLTHSRSATRLLKRLGIERLFELLDDYDRTVVIEFIDDEDDLVLRSSNEEYSFSTGSRRATLILSGNVSIGQGFRNLVRVARVRGYFDPHRPGVRYRAASCTISLLSLLGVILTIATGATAMAAPLLFTAISIIPSSLVIGLYEARLELQAF